MTTSLAQTDAEVERLKDAVGALLSLRVDSLEAAGGGRNSRVYRLTAGAGAYAVKVYFRHASDNRARMETEFGSLSFLWKNGIRSIPRPLAASPIGGFAIYEWIDGQPIAPEGVSDTTIDTAAGFLVRLAELRDRPGSASLGPASEACFSGQALLDNLQGRLRPLLSGPNDRALRAFLDEDLVPALDGLSRWSRTQLRGGFESQLEEPGRTLSPSDFGFHNALRRPTGKIVFLDLEYFGWDDPAKMVCDFLLHPGMNLPDSSKRRFATTVVRGLAGCAGMAERVIAFYPLFGLKWALILLNEFLPEQLLRRRFAGMTEEDRHQRQREQLDKARNTIRRVLAEHEHFPYLD